MATLPVSYSNVGEVGSAFPAISSVTAINSAIVAQMMGSVEAEINVKIGKRYDLPLTVECPILQAISTRETIYRLLIQRQLIHFPAAQQGKHPLMVQHQDDQKLLDQIMNGEIQLTSSSGEPLPADTTQMEFYSTTKDYIPTFNEGLFENMIQDNALLDAIDDDTDAKAL